MAGWRVHDGTAIALPLANIDTDQLLPARFMSTPRAEGYGGFLLHDVRRDAAGNLKDMALNLYPDASVLVAGRNFGGGSSREAAVYALVDAGFACVIAPSFGDIFASNAINNGLLPAVLSDGECAELTGMMEGSAPVQIDVETGTIHVGGRAFGFDLDDSRRQKLVNGWDDIDLTQAHGEQITRFRDQRRQERGWAWPG